MVRGLRDDGKVFRQILVSVVLNAHCRGAMKSEPILDALAAEVNEKS
jgi:hypothetical protein